MREVAIIGAGELGGVLAHVLARRQLVRTITIVDDTGHVAAGKALDIGQAAAIEGFATQISGSIDVSATTGASIVVIADRVGGGEIQGDDGLMVLRRLAHTASSAVVLCAGAAQRDLVARGVRDAAIHRSRLFGSAPEALVTAGRALVALTLNRSPRDVALTVLGLPPAHIVIPWQDAACAGVSLLRQIDEPTRRGLDVKIGALWPPGPYALASAAVKVIEVMEGRSRQLASCFVAPEKAAAARVRTAALPVRLDPSGIVEVVLPPLSVVEQVALDNAMML
jgi:malate/lactate dehydrogenase